MSELDPLASAARSHESLQVRSGSMIDADDGIGAVVVAAAATGHGARYLGPQRWASRHRVPPRLRDPRGSWRYHVFVDALERDDRERSLATPPEVKLAQALEMMAAGMRIARAKLEREHPGATAAELDELFRAWLAHDD